MARLSRRSVLGGLAAATVAPTVRAATQKPFKIGLVTVRTGPIAQVGAQMEQGFSIFMKERANQLAGRDVQVVVADSGGSPSGARTKVQELIERDQVDLILGPIAAFEALAVHDYIHQAGVPMLTPAGAEDLTQRKADFWIVRISASSAQTNHPLGEYAAKVKGYKRVITLAEDFAYGHEQVAGFQRVFEERGGQVVKKLWPPIAVPDMSPFIAQIDNADALFVGLSGSNPIKFFRQYRQFGVSMPVLAGATAVDEPNFKNVGEEMLGVVSAAFYSDEIDTPSNKYLIAQMKKDYDALPGYFACTGYVGGQFIEAALQNLKGEGDNQALMRALRSVALTDTPRGPISLDDLGNPISNVYIREVQRKDSQFVNTILYTYNNVNQFFDYDKSKFLAEQVYSRDFPPARFAQP
jgi:branched-chain amino acid transport system substrate-binding protein